MEENVEESFLPEEVALTPDSVEVTTGISSDLEWTGEGSINYSLKVTEELGESSVEVDVDIAGDLLTVQVSYSETHQVSGGDGEDGPLEISDEELVSEGAAAGDFLENETLENDDEAEAQCESYYPPIEELVSDGDSMLGNVSDAEPRMHISKMRLCSKDEALEIANYVLFVLEEDLFNYFNSFEEEDKALGNRPHLHIQQSTLSLDSNFSDPLPGEPSSMTLFYEYEATTQMPRPLKGAETTDAATNVNLHRTGPQPPTKDASTITKEMTFVDALTSQLVFRHNYPLKDDYKPPEVPSRTASLEVVMTQAVEAEQDVEKPRIGPKIRWGKKKRLLPPLPQNYYKQETFWTGSVYSGKYQNRQFEHGRFEYPLMSVYESEFKDGHAHTDKHLGCVVYPRGDKFEGEWVKGRHVSGKITFADDLKFEQHNWSYLEPPDRRFYIEKDIGIKQAGKTLFNDRFPPPYIPPGEYDTGYGIFNADTGVVRGYNGEKIRDASYSECKWIMSACRKVKKLTENYQPKFLESRIPGCSVEKFVKQ